MSLPEQRKKIVDDVFSITGFKMQDDDPLVTAALFYSQVMRDASEAASVEMRAIAGEIKGASEAALAANRTTSAARMTLMKDIERHVVRCVGQAGVAKVQAGEIRYVPVWQAAAGAIIVGVMLATTWHFGFAQGAEHAQEAAVGRTFTRAVSTMDPKLRDQVIDHIRKNAG